METEDYPLNEDFFIGEDPKNLPQFNDHELENDDFAEPLPDKYLSQLPEYFIFFCKPYISKNGDIRFNVRLDHAFLDAIKIHYSLKDIPSKEKLCKILESELKKIINYLK